MRATLLRLAIDPSLKLEPGMATVEEDLQRGDEVTGTRGTLRCKVAVVGDIAAGKSALVQMHQSGGAHYPSTYKLTPGVDLAIATEAYSSDGEESFEVGFLPVSCSRSNWESTLVPFPNGEGWGMQVQVELFLNDCSGSELFRDVVTGQFPGSHAVALIVDSTNPSGLESAERWLAEVKKRQKPRRNLPLSVVLVATKVDDEDRRALDPGDLEALAEKLGASYFECSALPPGRGIQEPFKKIVEDFTESYLRRLRGLNSA